jgi:Tol biopolymer transport system component
VDVVDGAGLSVRTRKRRAWMWPTTALILIGAIASIVWWAPNRRSPAIDRPLTVVPLTTDLGVAMFPSFSPDGNQIAYQWDQDKREPRIFIKVVGPGEPIRLTNGASPEGCPAWSPDGKLVAFIRSLGESHYAVILVPPLGGAERRLTEFAAPIGYNSIYYFPPHGRVLDWAWDARHLIVSIPEANGNLALFVVSPETGEKRRLLTRTAETLFWERDAAISRNRDLLVFSRAAAFNSDVYGVRLTSDLRSVGEPRQLTSEASLGRFAQDLTWTPDGREFIYCSNRSGRPALWRLAVTPGATPRQVPSVGFDSYSPAVSQRGRLAYVHGYFASNIWRQEQPSHTGAMNAPVRLIASTAQDTSPQYSPDGTHIAIQSARSGNKEIWTCGSDGQHCRQLTFFNGPVTGMPRWSPDGKQIAFDSSASGHINVYVVSADGGRPRRLTDDPVQAVIPSWSQDGKWIYYSSARTGRSEIWKTPSSGGTAHQVTRNGGVTALESPDGKAIYYTRSDINSTLFRSDLDGNGETKLADHVFMRGFVVTPDRLYYLRREPGIATTLHSLSFATGKDRLITTVTSSLDLGLSVSPDGKYILYAQIDRSGSNLMLVEDFH